MISKKTFLADGATIRFLSDFIIRNEQYARPYVYIYDNTKNPNGSEDVLQDGTTNQANWSFPDNIWVRGTDYPTSSDIVPTDKWKVVDNSLLFYVEPTSGTTLYLEVASTVEEFGDTLFYYSQQAAQLKAWESEASQLTSDSYATEAYNVPVKVYTSNADGTFTITNTTEYSALHWRTVAETKVRGDVADVDTLAELVLFDSNVANTVVVRDVEAGGVFMYDAARVAENDGGIVLDGWVRQFSGPVNVKWFGAKGDGVTDDTAAIQSAITVNLGDILVPDGDYIISNTITVSSKLLFSADAILTASATFPIDSYMLSVSSQVDVVDPTLECTSRANGINVAGGTIKIFNPKIDHMYLVGIKLAGGSGDSEVHNPEITQWSRSDAEFAVDANFTADGIYVNRADCRVYGGVTRWCGIPIHLGPNCNTFYLINHHPYNGRPDGDTGGPRLDPSCIVADSGANAIINGCYLDNGITHLYSPGIRLRDCSFLCNDLAVTYTDQTLIKVYANGQAQPYQLGIETATIGALPVGYTTIAFVPFDVNVWTGDYSQVDIGANLAMKSIDGEAIVQHRSSDDVPLRAIYKPTGIITEQFYIGTSNPVQELINAGYKEMYTNALRLYDLAGTGAGALYFRNTVNGITENGAGTVEINAGGQSRVQFVSNGVLRPTADGTQQLGGALNKWSAVYSNAYYIGTTIGVSGTFTSNDGKTITVTGGIITAIV